MKKSLSLLLALAMVFSMFASVAFAADDTAPQTTLDKFNALKDAGIFKGVNDAGDPGLDQTMTRAQAAVVVSKLFKLDTSNPPATATFSDVPSSHWASAYVEAAVKAGIIHGVDATHFNDKSDVTTQDLAVMLVLGFEKTQGLDVDASATVDGSVSAYAQQYVAAAIANHLIPAADSYKQAALRSALVDASYSSYEMVQAGVNPDEIGIASAKQTGTNTIEVTLNGSVDTSKAELAVSKYNSNQTLKTAWDSANKVATLTLDTKITDATYTVSLSGIDNLDAKKETADVAGQAEKISTIKFDSASDTIAQADKVVVSFTAYNQFDEATTMTANNFRIIISGATYQNVSGKTAVRLNTTGLDKGTMVPVTIIYDATGAQANKVFKVGDEAMVAKVEIGDLVDVDGNKVDYVQTGKSAYLQYTAYDQYGMEVTDAATLNTSKGVSVISYDNELVAGDGMTTPVAAFVSDVNGDGKDDLMLTSKGSTEKTITLNVFANYTAQSVSKQIQIAALKAPASVEFGDFSGTLADKDVDKYVPLVVKDSEGNTLTPQQIVDNADQFTIYAIGGSLTLADPIIETSGSDKGKIHISKVSGKGNNTLVVQLKNNPDVKQTIGVSVSDKRKPETLKWDKESASKVLYGATNKFKIKVYDQYGSEYKAEKTDDAADVTNANNLYLVDLHFEKVSGDGTTLAGTDPVNDYNGTAVSLDGTAGHTDAYILVKDFYDKEFNFTAPADDANYRLSAKVIELKTAGADTNFDPSTPEHYASTVKSDITSELSKSILVSTNTSSSDKYTYSVGLDSAVDNTIFAVGDHFDKSSSVTEATYGTNDNFAKKITLSAKDSNGNTVATNFSVTDARSVDNSKVAVGTDGTDYYVVGVKPGTTKVLVTYQTTDGFGNAQLDVTVKGDIPQASSVSVGNGGKAITRTALHASPALKAWDAALAGDIKVKDQYGTEFKNDELVTYQDVIGASFYISNIRYSGDTHSDTISIDSNGNVNYGVGTGDLVGFTINVYTSSGKTATCDVDVTGTLAP